jgi:hypothetical protein
MWTLLRRWWFIWRHYKQFYHTAIITLALVFLLSRRCDFTSPPLFLVFDANWLCLSLMLNPPVLSLTLSLFWSSLTLLESDPNCQLTDANWTVSELNCLTVWVLCYDRRSAGQSVLEQSTHLGLTTRSWLLSYSCGFVDLGRPLWREDGSVVCNCYWSSPAQSFLGPSPVGLVAIFYSLDSSLKVTVLDCLTTDVTSREVSPSRTDLKTRNRIVRCHKTTYLLRRKLLRWFPLPRKWTSDMFPIFRGWLLRGLVIVTYETATQSVAVV